MKKVKLIALITAVIAAVLLYNFLNSISKPANVEVSKIGAVTAAMNIPPNVIITEEMIAVSQLPVEAVHVEALQNTELAIGKVSSSEIIKGEQVLSSKLVKVDGGGGNGTLAYEIKSGMRAITIGVSNLSGISGMIKPKNTVDILAQFQKTEGEKITDYTTMVVQNITVLAVDNVLSQEGKGIAEDGSSYTTVTLQVTPQQAMELYMSENKGALKMLLRSPLDQETTAFKSITFDNVVVK